MPVFKFQGVDFIEFDALFSDEERMVRDTARKFIEDNLVPIIEQCNREGRFPRELVKPMGELGFFGRQLEGLRLRRDVQRGVRPGDAGTRARRLRLAFVRQRAIGAGHVSHLHFRQRRAETKWLPKLAKGEKLGCFGLTEPDFGSNPAACARAQSKSATNTC